MLQKFQRICAEEPQEITHENQRENDVSALDKDIFEFIPD